MNDFSEIKERVKAAVSIADIIGREVKLSGGPNEFKALCPFHTEKTPSFTVTADKGFFHCFGCGVNGDVFEFVMRTKGMEFMGALKWVANSVGIAVPEPRVYQPPQVRQVSEPARGPFDPSKFRPLVEGGKVWNYLVTERKLVPELLVRYGVGETVDGDAYAFNYKWWPPAAPRKEGSKPRLEFLKVVNVDRFQGKKVEWREPKGGKNILFGMTAVPEDAKELLICEGELDAISWAAYGYHAVSVPGGASYTGWLDVCFEWLQRFTKIRVSFDEDPAGRTKLVEIVKRLGMARTDIIRLPETDDGRRIKDANDCLKGGITAEQMAACCATPEVLHPDKFKGIFEFEEEIWQKFHPEGTDQLGLLLPWGNHHGSSLAFRFRYGEVTVWTGFNKHGKSELLNHCILDLCWQGDKALICSLEVSAPETYRKLIRMAMARRDVCGKDERHEFRDRCLKPLSQKIWCYDHVGNAPMEEILNTMLYAFQRYGVRQFVLDSLMRFEGLDGEGQEQWNRQKDLMNSILLFAAKYGVHVHLVAHSKKPDKQGENKIPRRYDVMGSSYISNLAYNVIVVWRNRLKQDKLEEILQTLEEEYRCVHPEDAMPKWRRLLGGSPPKDAPDSLRIEWVRMIDFIEKEASIETRGAFMSQIPLPDAYFIVDAQRGGDGDCPARHLWFHYDSLQFIEASPWNSNLGPNDNRKRPVEYVKKPVFEMDEEL